MMKAALFAAPVLGTELRWATFDGAVETTAPWKVQNDPVMGGVSTSDFKLTSDNTGVFKGSCNIIPYLGAPGVATLRSQNFQFADATDFENIALKVKSSTPDFQGFKISFGAPGVPNAQGPHFGPPQDGYYKADFVLSGSDWQVIEVPLAQFSYDWSSYTGRCDSKDPAGYGGDGPQHNCCSDSGIEPSSPDVCVDSQYLNTVNYVDICAEGVEGEFNLEIEWIGATKSDLQVQV